MKKIIAAVMAGAVMLSTSAFATVPASYQVENLQNQIQNMVDIMNKHQSTYTIPDAMFDENNAWTNVGVIGYWFAAIVKINEAQKEDIAELEAAVDALEATAAVDAAEIEKLEAQIDYLNGVVNQNYDFGVKYLNKWKAEKAAHDVTKEQLAAMTAGYEFYKKKFGEVNALSVKQAYQIIELTATVAELEIDLAAFEDGSAYVDYSYTSLGSTIDAAVEATKNVFDEYKIIKVSNTTFKHFENGKWKTKNASKASSRMILANAIAYNAEAGSIMKIKTVRLVKTAAEGGWEVTHGSSTTTTASLSIQEIAEMIGYNEAKITQGQLRFNKSGVSFNATAAGATALKNFIEDLAEQIFEDGYAEGYADGYADGYRDGWSDALAGNAYAG